MKSGDRCPAKCGGRLHVRNSERRGSVQVQYLACAVCGHRPEANKVILPAEAVRRRTV